TWRSGWLRLRGRQIGQEHCNAEDKQTNRLPWKTAHRITPTLMAVPDERRDSAAMNVPFALAFRSTLEPNRHAGLQSRPIAVRIETQAQRIAIVIANRTLGLPGRKRAKRHKLGDRGGSRFPSRLRDLDLVAHGEAM